MSYLNEEVNCTEPFPLVSIPCLDPVSFYQKWFILKKDKIVISKLKILLYNIVNFIHLNFTKFSDFH